MGVGSQGLRSLASRCLSSHTGAAGQQVPLVLSFPGAGTLIFWQLGVIQGLSSQYDLSKVPMLGSSSGAVACAIAKSGASLDTAVDRGLGLLKEYGVVNRSWGLVGILGRLTRQWMQDVLPPGAGAKCSGGNATLLVTTLPFLKTHYVTDYKCDRDLMEVVMASAHIPVVVDWRLWVNCRWRACIDGGLWWLLRRSTREYQPHFASHSMLLTPFEDPNVLQDLHILRRIRPSDMNAAHSLVHMGQEFAAKLGKEHHQLLSLHAPPLTPRLVIPQQPLIRDSIAQ